MAEQLSVLHADPDERFVAAVERAVADAGVTVETVHAPTYEAAVTLFDERRFDCVLADQALGSGTGVDLLRHVRADGDGATPFLIVTDAGSEAVASEAISAGVTDYVRKRDEDVAMRVADRMLKAVADHRADRARRDRSRELATLHAVSAALAANRSMADALREIAVALPKGFKHPRAAAARVEVDGEVHETPTFRESAALEETAFAGETTVRVAVARVTDEWTEGGRSDDGASPVLPEERELLRAVADLIAVHVERADAIERLRTFAERLDTILQHTTNVVFMKDLEGRYLLVNRAFEEFVGAEEAAILERRPEEFFDAETAAAMHEHDRETLAAGELRRFEERYARDGMVRRFVTVRVPLFDEDGEPYAVYGIATDITEETRLDEERAELLDRMTDGILALDADNRVTFLNDRAAELAGVDPNAVLEEEIWTAFPEARDSAFEAALEKARRTGEQVTRVDYYPPVDRWFEARYHPSDSGVSIYFRDVTESVREREELKRREETMRRLYETIADKESAFDEKVRSLLALGKEVLDAESGLLSRVDGEEYIAEIAEDDTGQFAEGTPVPLSATNCERVVATERSLQIADVRDRPDLAERAGHTEMGISCYVGAPVFVDEEVYGTFCFYDRASRTEPFSDWEVTLVDLMARWVSYELERQHAAAELARERDRLEAFAGMVSHDLRNPLNVAVGHLDLALEEIDHESLDQAARALDRMRVLIDDALSFARLGNRVVEYDPVDLAAVAEEAWATVDTYDAELRLAAAGTVTGDASRIRTLFENLFRNAVEHAGADAVVEVGSLPGGFHVDDDGPGFPAGDRDDVFDLGVTTRSDGTGFGLAIVREIAEAHGWRVAAEESPLGGARVAVRNVELADDGQGE